MNFIPSNESTKTLTYLMYLESITNFIALNNFIKSTLDIASIYLVSLLGMGNS
jgi:hypothetical protein